MTFGDIRTIDDFRDDIRAGGEVTAEWELDLAIALGYDTMEKLYTLTPHPFTPAPPDHVHIAEVYGLGPDEHYFSRRLPLPHGWGLVTIEDGRLTQQDPIVHHQIIRTFTEAAASTGTDG